jgi:putative phosphoribosyl transferase
MVFRDRKDAGQQLAARLEHYAGAQDAIVLALPRGGVPVAYEVARALHLPMDVFVVRKLGVPWQPELAMGAIASGGVRVLNHEVVRHLALEPALIERIAAEELAELERREREYRGRLATPELRDRTVILIDDGLATGSTMRAAAAAVRAKGAHRVIVAVPVAARSTCDQLRNEVDEIVCPVSPEDFHAVGQWYEDFSQTTDDQVRELLLRAGTELPSAA